MPLLEQERSHAEKNHIEIRRLPLQLAKASDSKQRQQMAVALALLLVTLSWLLYKDRDFWFPGSPVAETYTESFSPEAKASSPTVQSKSQLIAPTFHEAKAHTNKQEIAENKTPDTAPIISRAILPPLEIEVVAGNQHRTVSPGNSSFNVETLPEPSSVGPQSLTTDEIVSEAAVRTHLSADTAQVVAKPVEPNYPVLAKQMKVQGSVVLQALIGKDGRIQELRVLSGPAILSSAALQAVRQWRFKPYLQGSRAVETEARVTVNFTISAY
jgi:TonB family protein